MRFAGLLLAACLAAPLTAQSGKAELFGAVRDTAGLPINRAAVRVEELFTRAAYNAQTTSDGKYHFSALPPGSYRIAASKAGFETHVRDGIQIRVADRLVIDLTLA